MTVPVTYEEFVMTNATEDPSQSEQEPMSDEEAADYLEQLALFNAEWVAQDEEYNELYARWLSGRELKE